LYIRRAKSYSLKLLFSFILLFAFFLRPATKISIISYYSLNTNSIVQKYCINKAKPELKCNGKCYLKKQLKFSTNNNHDKVKNLNFAEAFTPVFIHSNDYYSSIVLKEFDNLNIPSNNQKLFEQLIFFEIEYPPEYS